MDHVRTELLPPVLIADMHREARQRALAAQVESSGWSISTLAMHLGALLVHAGCHLQAAGRRHMTGTPLVAASPKGACGD